MFFFPDPVTKHLAPVADITHEISFSPFGYSKTSSEKKLGCLGPGASRKSS